MRKAEERAKERFPDLILGGGKHMPIKPEILCLNEESKEVYIEGYRQAEKDLELSWRDIRCILDTADKLAIDYGSEKLNEIGYEDYCKEVLARYMEIKKE